MADSTHRFSPANSAKAGDLTFAENETYFALAEKSAAAAILVDGDLTSSGKTLIRVPNARIAFAKVLPLFFPEPIYPPGIHPTAIMDGSAVIDSSAHVGPHCVVGANVKIGARSVLQGGNHIGAESRLGEEVNLFPNVTLYSRTQIGDRVRIHSGAVLARIVTAVLDEGNHRTCPSWANVIGQDDVEIAPCNDRPRRARVDDYRQRHKGRQPGADRHNVVTGEHCLLIAQVGMRQHEAG
jgi:UDP-3-O-[3-hydroxymyristoyl] glucosamine N-acyltransferase